MTSVPVATTSPEFTTSPTSPESPEAPEPAEPEWAPEPVVVRTRPIAPGEDVHDDLCDDSGLLDSAVRLPPGWYGNPKNPGGPVQWWDGSRLTDGPG